MTASSGGNVPERLELIENNQEAIKRWLDFCRKHPLVICREYDVPQGILPKGYNGVLIDVKVGGKKRVPDDKIYMAHEELRTRVARGNCVLELNCLHNGRISETIYIFLIFALKKFSGGLGDEDDSNCAQSQWTHYFIKDISKARKVICTTKENGEAAHVSSRKLFGQTYFCIGSKNVHMLVRKKTHIEKYTDSRFSYARNISTAFFDNYIDNVEIPQDRKDNFIDFVSSTGCTGVFEVLQPDHQHVVNLSYLKRAELKFICWTKPDLEEDFQSVTLTVLPANLGIDKAREFGLVTTDYEVVSVEDVDPIPIIEEYMLNIRKSFGSEGKVLYFMDGEDSVIGIIKKKTAWYIILRALREKVAAFSSSMKSTSMSERTASIKKRIKAIQRWLGFGDSYLEGWIQIAVGFATWVENGHKGDNIRDNFPVIFENYLETNDALREGYRKLLSQFDAKTGF